MEIIPNMNRLNKIIYNLYNNNYYNSININNILINHNSNEININNDL